MQRELDDFISTDEVVRHNLDRRDKVSAIRHKVDDAIKKSMMDVIEKSPQKARRREGTSSYAQFQGESQFHASQL